MRAGDRRSSEPALPPTEVLESYGLDGAIVQPLGAGLINRSWLVQEPGGGRFVLQAVNPMFPPAIHEDIAAVTSHLCTKGVPSPRLVPSRGRLWVEHGDRIWRLLTYVEGLSREAIDRPSQAEEAGRALARFHTSVADLQHVFKNTRLGVHDTAKHLAALRGVMVEHSDHRRYAEVAALAEQVFALARDLPAFLPAPDRIVHGDPKISNIVFDAASGEARCLVDLDTLTRMPVALELGDAFRSWCNPAGEDASDATFSLPLFDAAVRGYAERAALWLEPNEWRAIPAATYTIAVELAARFCADALVERYFAWDSRRYADASSHNQARTRGQLAVAAAAARLRDALDATVARAFGRQQP
jgi:Ser/Thr protein kinase RdoA (MazF antagonist)